MAHNLAPVPTPQPGFAALNLAAPVILQINAQGAKYKNQPPKNLDEEKLRAVVQHIVNSKAMASTSSRTTYCSQCAMENRRLGVGTPGIGTPNYIPVIMMPIYSADKCPFNMDCEMDSDKKVQKKKTKPDAEEKAVQDKEDKDDSVMRMRKQYSLERFSNFDLLSQW